MMDNLEPIATNKSIVKTFIEYDNILKVLLG